MLNGTIEAATERNERLASEDWQITDDGVRALALTVQKRRGVCVLPYMRFVAASGDGNAIKIFFASHIVLVSGSRLDILLDGLALQRVHRLIEPTENEGKFGVRGVDAQRYDGPAIHRIEVQEPKEPKAK